MLKQAFLRVMNEPRRKKLAAAAVGSRGTFCRAIGANAEFHEWLKQQGEVPYFTNRYEMYGAVQTTLLGTDPIDYLEFGVRHGASILFWATLNHSPESRFVGFDSFEGLPEAWESATGTSPKGSYSVGGAMPETSDKRVCFIKGWFNDTLRPFMGMFDAHSRLVIHNDADLFSSTLYTLATLDPIIKPGTVLIFDEFANPLHEWAAFQSYLSAFRRKCRLIGASGDYYTQMALELTE